MIWALWVISRVSRTGRLGNVETHYHVRFEGNIGQNLAFRRMLVDTYWPQQSGHGLKNIFAVSEPIHYDASKGGWVVNLLGEDVTGKVTPIFTTLEIINPDVK